MTQKKIQFNVIFLLDKKNNWIEKFLKENILNFPKKFNYKITKNSKSIKNKIVFALSYTRILDTNFILKNKEVLIAHPSKLPRDKGFSPVQNQILRGQNTIHVSLIKASKEVDSGPIAFTDTFFLEGHELSNEIREQQAKSIFKLIKKFLNNYPNISYRKQKGVSTFNKKRGANANKLNIQKSIKSQLNTLRISDNENYPAFFNYKKNTYVLKIFKKKN